MEKYIFYLDECFNTGNDWLNNDQPYFTYGGWIINYNNIEKAKRIVLDFKNKYQGNELKSKNFISHKKIREVRELANRLISTCKAKPYYVCFEKKYMIACKAVEAFFDSEYNKNIKKLLTYPNEYELIRYVCNLEDNDDIHNFYEKFKDEIPPIERTKKALANIISDDEKLCDEIGKVISGKIKEEKVIDSILNKMIKLFENKDLLDVKTALKKDKINKKYIFQDLCIYDDKSEKSSKILHLVKPSLYEMICNLNRDYKNLELKVDTLGKSNFLFKEIADILKININVVEDSKKDEMIMACDLLVGQIARVVKDIVDDSCTLLEEDLELLQKLFVVKKDTFKADVDSMWFFKFSNESWNKICYKLSNKNNPKPNFDEILKNNFKQFLK